ncbi:DODA-type extradiol aromatic ring-opening family dioxygenase [Halarcobacter bivalviorum]|uniref:Dioxygenase n=1 Tax=Halarcobacter bivalviorum TaxID=663364 RepID=A0AAX2A5E4_9BACT|nr:class III extradiol ring-cleavage dioxygenase [Halarcobacter bivalviorum]AXH11180.1 dioxygenase, 4,5-DOPA dioxygenase family [Halarcobacter bivalviorum]RXK09452.1 dioxygenase [Halarcobacter bivalviorum]
MNSSLFISHGAPNIILKNSLSKTNFENFSKRVKKPQYIIIFSAHYLTKTLKVINYEKNSLLYDFYGFEKELYEFKYEIKSDKEKTLNLITYLKKRGIEVSIDKDKSTYDHGVWTALSMIYEKLNVPVIQLSIPTSYSYKQLINLGETLQGLKEEALIVGSGGTTHNLFDMQNSTMIKKYAKNFNNELINIVNKGKENQLLALSKTPSFKQNHPSDEHFLPLFIIFGSAKDKKGVSFNSEFFYSNISMESFYFDKEGLLC